jgi:hypothetical protein
MFRCDQCGRVTKPFEPAHIVPVETRLYQFPRRPKAHVFKKGLKTEVRDDPGGQGTQIVREAKLCKQCFDDSE